MIKIQKVLRVSDGDSLRVETEYGELTIRLIFCDTEESLRGVFQRKPVTNAGVLASNFAKEFFCQPGEYWLEFDCNYEDEVAIALQRDIYNRVLAYVYRGKLNFNLELVRQGYSPYFCKYGFSQRYHEEFLEGQWWAMNQQFMIWNPETNQGGNSRDYGQLVLWWFDRADQLGFALEQRAVFPSGCDNKCPLIKPETFVTALADGQNIWNAARRNTKGVRLTIGRPGFPFVVWLDSRGNFSAVLARLDAIASRKMYVSFIGQLHQYRGIPQLRVTQPEQIY